MITKRICECGWSTIERVTYCESCGVALKKSEISYYIVTIDGIMIKVQILKQTEPFIANDINSEIANTMS